MNTPIKVAGLTYQISELDDDQMQGRIGFADFNNQLIGIGKNFTTQTKKIAVLHEIMHILSDAYGLDLTEQQVKIGTHALIAFITDNPDFKS